jgi:ketosteroid isomerase-like protein
MPHRNVEFVERLWRTLEREGLDAMLELVPDDVVWEPVQAGGRGFRGHDELRGYFAETEAEGRLIETVTYDMEPIGDHVLVSGSMRVHEGSALEDTQPAWVYYFEGERFVRAVGYASVTEARGAIAQAVGR